MFYNSVLVLVCVVLVAWYADTYRSLFLSVCRSRVFGSRPSDHYFSSLLVCLFACAEFFSAIFDPISIKLGYMLYVWV